MQQLSTSVHSFLAGFNIFSHLAHIWSLRRYLGYPFLVSLVSSVVFVLACMMLRQGVSSFQSLGFYSLLAALLNICVYVVTVRSLAPAFDESKHPLKISAKGCARLLLAQGLICFFSIIPMALCALGLQFFSSVAMDGWPLSWQMLAVVRLVSGVLIFFLTLEMLKRFAAFAIHVRPLLLEGEGFVTSFRKALRLFNYDQAYGLGLYAGLALVWVALPYYGFLLPAFGLFTAAVSPFLELLYAVPFFSYHRRVLQRYGLKH